jgi:hypothetical protein
MMHGPEKSDPGIVAMKPANKTEQSVAEPVERRAGTKGNADQQSTCRTQSRISVSQALERIRKVQNAAAATWLRALVRNCGIVQRTGAVSGAGRKTHEAARLHGGYWRRGVCVAVAVVRDAVAEAAGVCRGQSASGCSISLAGVALSKHALPGRER